MPHPVFFRNLFANLVQHVRALQRTDAQCCGEKVEVVLFCSLRSPFKSQIKAYAAPIPAFCTLFEPFYRIVKLFWLKLGVHECHLVFCRQLVYKQLLFGFPFEIFIFGVYVRVVIKNGNLKIVGEILQHVTAARRAAAVDEQFRNCACCREVCYQFVKFFLIIAFLHKKIVFFCKVTYFLLSLIVIDSDFGLYTLECGKVSQLVNGGSNL